MSKHQTGKERRSCERLLLRCPVKFKANNESELSNGSAKDFSDVGLGFFLRKKLEQNMPIEMWIKVSHKINPLHIGGKVIWTKQLRARLWQAGIYFYQKGIH
jgi:hypothetical protein